MTTSIFSRLFGTTVNSVFKRFELTLMRTFLIYLIALLFVHIPTVWNWLIAMGRSNERRRRQIRLRAQLTDPTDPSSPYRAKEVLDGLQTQPNEAIQTLPDIPDYCVQRYADWETLGVREILDVQDEAQPNGKVFKKVRRWSSLDLSKGFSPLDLVRAGRLQVQHISTDIRTYRSDRTRNFIVGNSQRRSNFDLLRDTFRMVADSVGRVSTRIHRGDTLRHVGRRGGETWHQRIGSVSDHHIARSRVQTRSTNFSSPLSLNWRFVLGQKAMDQTPKVRHVVYFPPLAKAAGGKTKANDRVEYLALSQLEERGTAAQLGSSPSSRSTSTNSSSIQMRIFWNNDRWKPIWRWSCTPVGAPAHRKVRSDRIEILSFDSFSLQVFWSNTRTSSRRWPASRNAFFRWSTWRTTFTSPTYSWLTFSNCLAVCLRSTEERKNPVVFLFDRNSRLLFGSEMRLFVSSDVDGSIHSGETRWKGRFTSPSSAHHVLCPGQWMKDIDRPLNSSCLFFFCRPFSIEFTRRWTRKSLSRVSSVVICSICRTKSKWNIWKKV